MTFEDRIHQILDDRLTLTGDARLMEHAAVCTECETKLQDYESFDDSLCFLKENFAEVTCIVDDDGSTGVLSRPLLGLAGLAAALLICLNMFGGFTTNNDSGRYAQLAETKLSSPTDEKVQLQLSPAVNLAVAQPVTTKVKFKANRNSFTPDTSPFSPNFRLVDNLPRIPSASDFERGVSLPLEMLQPALEYSSEIPGTIAIHSTLNVTIELLRRSLIAAPKSNAKIKLGFG